jgi:tRNA(Ile)-lysidine synthase
LLLRPLLSVSKKALESWAREKRLAWVEDESNADLRYTRNAVRLKVMPVLSSNFPGFEKRLLRSAGHMQSAARLLRALAEMDFNACRDGEALDISRLAALGNDRFDNVLRFWLDRQGVRMPSAAWLESARTQLLTAREDAQVRLDLEGGVIRRYRQRLVFQKAEKVAKEQMELPERQVRLAWKGEARIPLAAFDGELLFEEANEGVEKAWLLTQPLFVGGYEGSARLKVSTIRPSRSLKAHCQERQIPPWERGRLPLLYAGSDLLFAAGIGTAVAYTGKGGGRVRIGWFASG